LFFTLFFLVNNPLIFSRLRFISSGSTSTKTGEYCNLDDQDDLENVDCTHGNEEESDISDIEEAGYADFTKADLEPYVFNLVQLQPTSKRNIKKLFNNKKAVKL